MNHEMTVNSSVGSNFQAHRVNLTLLEQDVRRIEAGNILFARHGVGKMLDPDQIEAVINKKVSAQLRIGKYHNNLEKQETKTRVADEQSHPEIDRLSNEVNSDYKVKPKSSIRRLRKLEAQAEARVKKRIRLGTAQDVSNNKLVGSQHQEPMHFPGEEEIKDRRR